MNIFASMAEVIVSQTLLFLLALLAFAMQYKYSDKRTKAFKVLRNIFIFVTVVAFPISIFISWKDVSDKQNEISAVTHNFDSVKSSLGQSILKLDSANYKLKVLDLRAAKLDSQLLPFLHLATKKYPQLNPDEALNRLKITIVNNTYINAPLKRTIGEGRVKIINALRAQPKGAYQLYYLSNDIDTYDLALELDGILKEARWHQIPPIIFMNKPGLRGITTFLSKQQEPLITFINGLSGSLNSKLDVSLVTDEKLKQISVDWSGSNVIPENIPTVLIFIGPNY